MRIPILRRVLARIGRRGAALLWFALVDVVLAASMAAAPPDTGAYVFLARILPLWAWAIPWAAVGVLCAVQAFALDDRLAFVAASALKVGWSVLYLAGWLLGEIPHGYIGAAIWLVFAGFVQVIAGWPEPPRLRRW
ncbi:hypothetical protein ACWENQ_44785 [Nonomuraea sp. NPDC004354]